MCVKIKKKLNYMNGTDSNRDKAAIFHVNAYLQYFCR